MSATDDSPAAAGIDALRAAGVGHDVNQMLAVIRGRAELLLRQPGAPVAHLQAILLAAGDASTMLERLRPGDDHDVAAPGAPADAGRVVDQAASFALPPDGAWAAAATAGRWALLNRVAPGTAVSVPAAALREVLTNLLLNALRALSDGGVVVVEGGVVESGVREGGVAGATADRGRVRLRVADDGPGLPPGDPEQVFVAGFTTSGRPGRGVGLASCRQLLSAYDGVISATTGGGPGAVFTLDLPASAAPPAVDETAPGAGVSALPPGLGVLVVDDEAAVRDMLTDVLGELGCRVWCCRDGAAALAAATAGEAASAAIALVDQRLPGASGAEVLASLRARLPALATVAMTGWEGSDAPPAVADFALRKPLGVEQLADVLARAAAVHRARRGDGEEGGRDR